MNQDIAHYSTAGNLDSRVFLAKSRLLAKLYQPMEAQEFMHEIFGNAAMDDPVVATDTNVGNLRRFMSRQAAWEAACRNGSIKMAYGDFFGPPQASTLRQLHAFVIDIDDVDAGDLASIMEAVRQQQERLRLYLTPSYVVNSGCGVHVVFSLDEPVQAYKRNTPAIRTILTGLQQMFRIRDALGTFGHVDNTSLIQPFRMPGVATKFGVPAEAFRCGPKYSAAALAEFFGVVLKEVAAQEAAKRPKRKKATIYRLPPIPKESKGKPGLVLWYGRAVLKAGMETPSGTRARAMLALAVMGHMAGVPKEHVRQNLEDLVRAWNKRDHHRINPTEIDKALRGFGRYRMRRATLAEHLGFDPCKTKVPAPPRVTLRDRIAMEIERRTAARLPFTSSSIARALEVPLAEVSRLVKIKAGGKAVFWKV